MNKRVQAVLPWVVAVFASISMVAEVFVQVYPHATFWRSVSTGSLVLLVVAVLAMRSEGSGA